MRKKELINQINSFYGYLKTRWSECEKTKDRSGEDLVQFNVTNIIKNFYYDEFFKVLKCTKRIK